MAEANPTVRQREVGARLRDLRNVLGLTVEDVAGRLLCSATKISRLETGARRASLRDVRDLCRIYAVGEQDAAELMDLARQAREPGWWTRYDDLKLSPYIGLEQDAVAITAFSLCHVPALLQTEDYAQAIITAIAPRIDPEILRQRVAARLRRQQLLDRDDPPRYRALLDEAVLRRQVGGPGVMAGQLGRILDLAREGKVVTQVIPFASGAHAGLDSSFVLLESRDYRQGQRGALVYVETLLSQLYQERPAEVERYREAIEYLRDAALSPADSTDLITMIRTAHASSRLG